MKIPFTNKAIEIVEAPRPKIVLPSWLSRPELNLPAWAHIVPSVGSLTGKTALCIEGDTDGYVREWFALLGVEKTTQYWLEVAYQCAKLDLQSALVGTQYDLNQNGKPVEFKFTRAPQWELRKHPTGGGIAVAAQGKEARGHYRRVRGRLPY